MKTTNLSIPASFRDPSGFLFFSDSLLYRQVNIQYKDHYDHLMRSGLYDVLVRTGLLIPHHEVRQEGVCSEGIYKILRPERVSFVSYPYEWCFSQLESAALTTLRIQKLALKHGMTLKDATAYNIQFHKGAPILIDTLSFETCQEGHPWIAYRQFCQHFLAPLALMSYTDLRLNQLMKVFLDGIPLDMASTLLPRRTYFRMGLLLHIHLHARAQKRFASSLHESNDRRSMSKNSLLGLIESLESSVLQMRCKKHESAWSSYYDENNYSQQAMGEKIILVGEILDELKPSTVWDVGANTGFFSRLAAAKGIETISIEADPSSAEINCRLCMEKDEKRVLPLIVDLTNPSPNIGWLNQERDSLFERGPAEVILALALIHHLAISNNVPFGRIAECFSKLSQHLIIEFVPKSDSQVQRLLTTRADIFLQYDQSHFEEAFQMHFTILKTMRIGDSDRMLYLMRTREEK